MDYKEKYEEALARAKEMYSPNISDRSLIEYIFPDIKESENEKVRKAIHIYLDWLDGRKDYSPKGKYTIRDMIDWLNKQEEPSDKGEISDGYHTFNELYYYRMLYNAAFFNLLPKEWVHKSKRHHDGEECFGGGWFIVMANLPTGQISNHYELKDWDLFKIQEKEIADEWDGHTPQEASDRLYRYLLGEAAQPKFKVGDWITNGRSTYCVSKVGRTDINTSYYTLDSVYELTTSEKSIKIDSEYHLWTLKDAKCGDVLYDKSNGIIGLFEGLGNGENGGVGNDDSYCFLYCRLDGGHFYTSSYGDGGNMMEAEDACPAKSSQRILLFSEMVGSGYDWDSDKKNFKEIVPNYKVGEWLTYINGGSGRKRVVQVKDYRYGTYTFTDGFSLNIRHEYCLKPWMIEDAEDGDVLTDGKNPFIFKGITNHGTIVAYCNTETIDEIQLYATEEVHPATKEDKNFLYEKIIEWGWTWNEKEKTFYRLEPLPREDTTKKNVDINVDNIATIKEKLDYIIDKLSEK